MLRLISGESCRIEIEADYRHAENLIAQAGLDTTSRTAVTPGQKPNDAELGAALSKTDSSLIRSRAMRGSYLAEDRPDIRYPTREVARLMADPREVGLEWLKRIARYLILVPRLVQWMV